MRSSKYLLLLLLIFMISFVFAEGEYVCTGEPYSCSYFTLRSDCNSAKGCYVEDITFNEKDIKLANPKSDPYFKCVGNHIALCTHFTTSEDCTSKGCDWTLIPEIEAFDVDVCSNIASSDCILWRLIDFQYDDNITEKIDLCCGEYNTVLSDLINTTYTPSKNFYCTGVFGARWKETLSPSNVTELNDDKNLKLYKFTCNAQPTFRWTGTRCCGEKTGYYYDEYTERIVLFQEYYVDEEGGCFRGKPVMEGQTIAKSLNVQEFRDLLFYDGNFYDCEEGADDSILNYSNLMVRKSVEDYPFNKSLITASVNASQILAGHVCLNNKWLSFDEIPKVSLIAQGLMNDIGNENYYLSCDVNNSLVIPKNSAVFREDGVCLLTIKRDKEVRAVGFGFANIEELNSILKSLNSKLEGVCDEVEHSTLIADYFFKKCGEKDIYRVYVRKDFGIAIVANGEFSTTGIFSRVWTGVKNFFKRLLSSLGLLKEEEFTFQKLSVEISSNANHNFDDFDRFYYAKMDDGIIYGFLSKPENSEYANAWVEYFVGMNLCENAPSIVTCDFNNGFTKMTVDGSAADSLKLWNDLTSNTRLKLISAEK